MTPQDLIAAFEKVAEAPQGVKRLRELVLQLAVRGKLVPQDPGDEPASVLFRRVVAEKRGMEEAGSIKKQKPVSAIADAEILFSIPPTWKWVRAADISYPISSGSTPKKTFFQAEQAGGVPYLKVYNIRSQRIDFDYKRQFIDETHHTTKMKRSILVPGMVVLNIVGPPLGKTAIIPDAFPEWNCNQAIAFFRCIGDVQPTYLHLYLMAGVFLRNIPLVGTAGQDNLSVTKCKHIVVPLPPVAEQQRIVARVDELMGLLDRLEAARTARDTTRTAARNAVLAALSEADTAEDIATAWTRFAERMADLVQHPDDIKPIRQAVLQLAVRGKLVPQDPGDEPASVLLERIAQEKAGLFAAKTIRKQKMLPAIHSSEIPFDLPSGWEWKRIQDLSREVTDGVHQTPTYVPTGVPFLSIKDISSGFLDFRNTRFVTQEAHNEMIKRCRPEPGDILFCRIGTLGRAVVVDTEQEFSLFVSVGLIKMTRHIDSRFMQHVLNSPASYAQYDRIKAGGSHTNKLNVGTMRNAIMPVAPLAEQHRIVARVDELMAVLDRLEDQLTAADTTHTAFAAAAVHHLDA